MYLLLVDKANKAHLFLIGFEDIKFGYPLWIHDS